MSVFVGVDVGGTTSTIAIGDARRQVMRVGNPFATRSADGPAATIDDIVTEIGATLADLGASYKDIAGAAIATPGPATIDGTLISTSPNLSHPAWKQCDVRRRLEHALQSQASGVRVCYLGDGQAAVLGEYMIRSGKLSWDQLAVNAAPELQSIFLVTVGTGLGGGEVRDRRVIRGAQGRAGHAGHILLPDDAFRYPHDRQLKVGNAYSTVESAVSLTALTHQLANRLSLPQWREHPLNQAPGTVKDKAKQLRRLAADGDPLAIELFDDQAAAMGLALLCVNYLGDYDLLVIGGGVCDLSPSLKERYLAKARQQYHDRALDGFRQLPPIEFSVCGDHASVIGVLAHAYELSTSYDRVVHSL